MFGHLCFLTQLAILYLIVTLSRSRIILKLICKEMSGPKFELQNEKLLLTMLKHYCLSCLRFVAFTVAKTFQNTLVKWS